MAEGAEGLDVLVVGAGPTGLTMAAELTRSWNNIRKEYGELIAVQLILTGEQVPAGLKWDGTLFLDADRSLHRRYGCHGAGLYLIRPDGYVGYRSHTADRERLLAYLKTIFL